MIAEFTGTKVRELVFPNAYIKQHRKKNMSSDVNRINLPPGQQDLYKYVKYLKDFDVESIKKRFGNLIYASTNPANILYIRVTSNNNPMPAPYTVL